jgi:major inositol transporter-like SP family MFS transporter
MILLICGLATSYLLGKTGRKTLMQIGSLGCSISLIFIGIGFLSDKSTISKLEVVFGLLIYMSFFGMSLGPVVWLSIS